MFKDIQIIEHFIWAGRAVMTLENMETGNRITYKFLRKKRYEEEEDYLQVYRLIGFSNYRYIGAIFNKGKDVTWRKYLDVAGPSVVGMSWLVNKIKLGHDIPDPMIIHPSANCARCGRELTTPDSIKSGFGPICLTLSLGEIRI